MQISEGIAAMYHFHLSEDGSTTKGLCGAETMQSNLLLESWGHAGPKHLAKRYTYCYSCDRLSELNKL